MATLKAYYNSTTNFTATAKVVQIDNVDDYFYIRLNKTIFHPQGGGQPSDQGYINDLPLIKSINTDDGDISHIVANKCALKIGDQVTLTVDEKTRWKNAALHTAGHLIHICLMDSKYAKVISSPHGNHFPNQAKITYDVVADKINVDSIKELLANGIKTLVNANLPISIVNNTINGFRQIQIGEYDPEGCGGTHLPTTAYLDGKSFMIRKIKTKKGITIGYDCKSVYCA